MILKLLKPYLGCPVGTIIDTSMQSLHLDPKDLIRSGYACQVDQKYHKPFFPKR